MDNDVCSICYECMNDNDYILECNHKYHTKCIMTWFRNGNKTCPLCNDVGLDLSNMKWSVKIETIKQIKQLGRKKDCPKNIKNTLNKIKIMDEKEKKIKKELNDFKKDFKEQIQFEKLLKNKIWKNRRSKRELEYRLLSLVALNPIYIKLK